MGAVPSTVASLASLGLTAAGTVAKGQGVQAADEMQAARADRAAEFGKVQATLTDTTMRENLNTTLGNIDVIRAASNIDPSSPTTAALEDRQRQISDRQRTAAVTTINAQVADDQASANYLRQAGAFALSQSKVAALAGVLGGIGKAFGSFSGGSPGGGDVGDPPPSFEG